MIPAIANASSIHSVMKTQKATKRQKIPFLNSYAILVGCLWMIASALMTIGGFDCSVAPSTAIINRHDAIASGTALRAIAQNPKTIPLVFDGDAVIRSIDEGLIIKISPIRII